MSQFRNKLSDLIGLINLAEKQSEVNPYEISIVPIQKIIADNSKLITEEHHSLLK